MIGECMNMYLKLKFFMLMCSYGLCLSAMESQLSTDTRFVRARTRGSEIAVPATQELIHVPPMSREYRRSVDLMYSIMREDSNESVICERLRTLPLIKQCEIIETAEKAGFDWVLGLACSTYAQELILDKNLQLLFKDQATAHRILSASPRVTHLLLPFFHKLIEKSFSRILAASYRDTIRLYNPSVESDRRCDIFMMPTNTLNDIVYVVRDYKGTYLDSMAFGPIAPLLITRQSDRDVVVIDQEKVTQAVRQLSDSRATGSFYAFFDGLTYKSTYDGSLIVGLTGSEKYESDVLVVIKRIQGNTLAVTKALRLPSPIRTFPCIVNKTILRNVPLINVVYDMNASFMIRPYSHIAAYIDGSCNLNILDLDSLQNTQVTMQNNISSIAWSSDGKILAYASSDGALYLNECSTSSKKCFRYGNEIRKIQWSNDGTKILLMFDTKVDLVNSADGSIISTYTLHNNIVQAILSDDCTKILISCTNQGVYLFDVNTCVCRNTCKLDQAHIISLMLSPDNQYALISCVQNGALCVCVWNTEKHTLELYHGIDEGSYSVIAQKMQHGMPKIQSLTLAQLILLIAAEQVNDQRKFEISESHPLYSHSARCVPILRKYIMDKLFVK